ncbi:MAG: TAXI family TRAP transporter solute-binding subunit [Vicinamibacterales bacterium]|nr:TAXI family TRAP transporter solute-binding subunit [Vicinamibacterales bacterium]
MGFPRRSVAAILAAALVAAACNPQELARRAGARTRLSVATGGTGGVYYPYGGAIARVITEHLPGVEATAEVTAASVDNLKLVRDHKSDIAFSLADTLDDAVAGRGAFARKGPVPARVLAVLYDNYTHLVASGSSGVARIADLAGTHVSMGAAGSGTELIATRVLRAAGLEPGRDLTPVSLGVAQSVDALKDGKIDAFFWSGGVPTASVLDLASTPGMSWRLVPTDDALEVLRQTYGRSLYTRLTVPRDAYPGLPADVAVVGVANLLAVHQDMPDQLAYDITRLLFEHQAELVAVHREAANLTPATETTASPAPFHPGAIRYYRERGHWRN